MQKDLELISIPLNTKLKMQCAKNMEQLENFTEFKRLIDKSTRHLQEVKSRLHILDLKLFDKDGSNKKECVLITDSLLANGYVLKKSTNEAPSLESKGNMPQSQVTASEYDEIDQIYDYVRGLASLPKNLNNYESLTESSAQQKLPQPIQKNTSSSSSKTHKRENHFYNSDSWIKHELLEKPIPPSLKNLPSKKQLAQKRPTLIFTRTNSNNMSVSNNKNNNSNVNCTPSPQKDSQSPQSPLFHIR